MYTISLQVSANDRQTLAVELQKMVDHLMKDSAMERSGQFHTRYCRAQYRLKINFDKNSRGE